MCILPRKRVHAIRCQPKTHPCPSCGQRGRRVRRLERRVRSLAYQEVVWLHVYYAEYRARCSCRKFFRSWPLDTPPKSDYDAKVRQAVLDRILEDGLNVERTRLAMKRDFLLDLSSGFIYDCLDWQLDRLHLAGQRRTALQQFSGLLCIDELHLGEQTLLLATDPIADRVIGFLLVRINDQAHMRCFLRTLQHWGFDPKVVVTDGSNLYPTTLAEIWPQAKHQLCVFHVLQDVTKKVLDAVRRLRLKQSRRGNGGRKRSRGRPSKKQQARRQRRGPTNKEKAAYVFKHRFLVVKRAENLTAREWEQRQQMLEYLPELAVLCRFCAEVYQLFDPEQLARVARRRRTLLEKKGEYQAVPELEEALGLLKKAKFDQMVVFLESPEGQRVKTNNHVERANRQLRFQEKVRYKWRSERSLNRFLRLRLGRLGASSWAGPPTPPPSPAQANDPREVASAAGD
jgi:Transposase